MGKFKDFGTSEIDSQDISFKLFDEEFTCRPALPGKVILDLAASSADQENPGEAAKVVSKFFNTVLVPESSERFETLINDPDRVVTVEKLTEIVSWLVEQYTERPTQRPEVSPSGQ